MNAEAIDRTVRRLAREVLDRAREVGHGAGDLAVVGIRRGGVHLAQRLCAEIERAAGSRPPLGTLDIALYRDDVLEHAAPIVGPTDIRFQVQGRTIVLVDDVLYTGRTIRAALDQLVDFGRPRRVWLAVLVDRGGHELPIAADFVGARVTVEPDQDVEVRLREGGAAEDEVIVRRRGA